MATELLWNEGPYSLLAEYDQAWLSAPAVGDPEFSGYYLTASWVATGEHRPYDRKVGYARRVMPTKPWGAWELAVRYGRVDLDDAGASGGTLDEWFVGVNWWATRRWKASISFADADLDRFGVAGRTKFYLTRLQWIW